MLKHWLDRVGNTIGSVATKMADKVDQSFTGLVVDMVFGGQRVAKTEAISTTPPSVIQVSIQSAQDASDAVVPEDKAVEGKGQTEASIPIEQPPLESKLCLDCERNELIDPDDRFCQACELERSQARRNASSEELLAHGICLDCRRGKTCRKPSGVHHPYCYDCLYQRDRKLALKLKYRFQACANCGASVPRGVTHCAVCEVRPKPAPIPAPSRAPPPSPLPPAPVLTRKEGLELCKQQVKDLFLTSEDPEAFLAAISGMMDFRDIGISHFFPPQAIITGQHTVHGPFSVTLVDPRLVPGYKPKIRAR